DFFADQILERRFLFRFDGRDHASANAFFDALEFEDELLALGGIGDVIMSGRFKDGVDVLGSIGQSGVRAGSDALHALSAVLSYIDRCFAPGDIFGLSRAGACAHDTNRSQRAGGLMIGVAVAEFGIELRQSLESITRSLGRGRGDGAAATGAAPGGWNERDVAHWPNRRVTHARAVGVLEVAVLDFLHA